MMTRDSVFVNTDAAPLTAAEERSWLDLVRRFLARGYTLDDIETLAAMIRRASVRTEGVA